MLYYLLNQLYFKALYRYQMITYIIFKILKERIIFELNQNNSLTISNFHKLVKNHQYR